MSSSRQLAAIMFTDIVGYTALMQEDEQKAVTVIKHYNSSLQKWVAHFNGQVLNYYGDGSLCIFSSSTDAVNCSLEVQKDLQSEPVVPLRVGLHMGEVFFEDGKALGDAVNVASRIQSLGHANTILVSHEIFDKIRNHPEFKNVSLGHFDFKNVQEPIEVFALANDGLLVPQRNKMEGKLKQKNFGKRNLIVVLSIIVVAAAFLFTYKIFAPAKRFTGKEKSIAILPFTNMSNDKDNEYFSDGMTEELTTQLSKIANLKVIARTSAMLYKGSKKSIREIAEELNVTAILEGSVQKAGNEIRITAQLIDANSQEHIWANRYDRDLKDVFAIQSEVAQQIASQLNIKMTTDEKRNIEEVPTNNPQAYEYYLQGVQIHEKFIQTLKQEYFENSKLMFEKAIALDSGYALAHAGLANLYNTYTDFVGQDSSLIALQVSEINKAYALAPDLDYVNSTKGNIFRTTLNDLEESYKSFKKAFEINPNNTKTLYGFSLLYGNLGLIDERVALLRKAVKIDPLNATCFGFLGGAEVHLNRVNEGIRDLQTALRLAPDMFYLLDRIAFCYALQNDLKQADSWLKKFLTQIPAGREENFYADYGQYSGYCYAKLGDKKKALELSKHWRVYLGLGMKEEALIELLKEVNQHSLYNDYLILKSHLPHKDFDLIRNDPRFLELLEKKRMQYELNKSRFSLALPEN